MKHDGKISLATGMSAQSKSWKNKKMMFSEFVSKLTTPNKTNETFKEFIKCTKAEQHKIKDVGGYVGGYLRGGRRSPKNVVYRQIVTLDIDFAHMDFWDDFTMQFDNAAVLHGTHKHSEESPRFRLVMPLSREVTPDEYVAISRQIAGLMGIDLFDNTTFETNRLMFWPSSPKDVEYYTETQDGEWIDADVILDMYDDWKDTSLWPTADRDFDKIHDASKKQKDPTLKKGIVGLFCRTYTISGAIDAYLSSEYVPTDKDDRYTYTKGSTAAGLIVYDDMFAYSHHGTDPTSGKLCNAFDLVRLHLHGHLDDGSDEKNPTRLKSFRSMEDAASSDKAVKKLMARESLQEAKYDFTQDLPDDVGVDDEDAEILEEDIDWMTEMDVDTKGNYLSSAVNINAILTNDRRIKGTFKYNEFDNKVYAFKTLPWRKITKPEPMRNVDYSGVRNYIESIYGIQGKQKIEDSLILEFQRNTFHPIKEYLTDLEWDGVKRIEHLLIDYFGAEDNAYTREALKKTLTGAVARVFNPGCKFDLVLTLVGDQGTYKSTFIKKLGKDWFSDTFMTVHGKEALEQIQGAWLIEMAELAGLRKAEVTTIKHFITKQEDAFRPAYGRVSEVYKRQCVFFGTTNKGDFLTDPSGNRRFMPIDVVKSQVSKNVFTDLTEDEIDQIWAEATNLFWGKESLTLSTEAEKIAKKEQIRHSETDNRKGVIEEYISTRLPNKWDDLGLEARRDFLQIADGSGKNDRDYVCVAEIWCECLLKEKENMDRYKTREINDIMKGMDDWEYHSSTKNFKIYGKQKYYSRKLD